MVAPGIDLATVTELGPPALLHPPGEALWSETHDLRFDFQATADGAEWVDDLARTPCRRLKGSGSLSLKGRAPTQD